MRFVKYLMVTSFVLGFCCSVYSGLASVEQLLIPQTVLPSVQKLVTELRTISFPDQESMAALGWGPRELAMYLAGRLQDQGYGVYLARGRDEWWVMVQLQGESGEKAYLGTS